MKRRRLFDELNDMQAEVNQFFDDVHDRLSKIDNAMSGWNNNQRRQVHGWTNDFEELPEAFERSERQQLTQGGHTMIAERYEHRIYLTSGLSRPTHQSSHRLDNVSSPHLPPSNQVALPGPQPIPIRRENGDEEVLGRLEIAGLRPGEVDITVKEDSVTVTGRVYRKIMLPPGVVPSQVHAVYREGVLEIRSAHPKSVQKVEITFE